MFSFKKNSRGTVVKFIYINSFDLLKGMVVDKININVSRFILKIDHGIIQIE